MSFVDTFVQFFCSASNAFRNDELGLEIASIALPAILALAADPLASLIDSAFIGRIGTVELAAVGVSISVFNLVSKMFNIPLLNITTSFVAEDEVSRNAENTTAVQMDELVPDFVTEDEEKQTLLSTGPRAANKRMLPAVSSSLVLGTFLGLLEAAVLVFAAGPVLYVMGITADSPMRLPAEQYLSLRAIGAPAVVLALAIQGVFRGFKDTTTPLYSTVAGNIANVILDPILMFSLQYGVGGAAVATVVSQYLIVGLLLWILNKRVVLLPPSWQDLKVGRFLKSGGLLLGRTVALLATMTLATSMAARQGPTSMAAHQICLQIWLATSLLSDGLALAGQAIIAGSFAEGDSRKTKEVAIRVLQMGLILGVVMAIVLALVTGSMAGLFTDDAGVLKIVPYLIPFVAATQPINSLAFVFDGLHYGASDFAYAAYSMIFTATVSIIVLLLAPRWFGLPGVWIGLTVVMTLRMVAGFARIGTATGPWRFLKAIPEKEPLQ